MPPPKDTSPNKFMRSCKKQSKSHGNGNTMHLPHNATTTPSTIIHIPHSVQWGAETIYGSKNPLRP